MTNVTTLTIILPLNLYQIGKPILWQRTTTNQDVQALVSIWGEEAAQNELESEINDGKMHQKIY